MSLGKYGNGVIFENMAYIDKNGLMNMKVVFTEGN